MIETTLQDAAILVTGGAGFIGSHIVERLIEQGAHVTVLDNLSTGNLKNLEHVKDKITFIKGDITHQETCLNASKNKQIIFHLAAEISVPYSMEDPKHCYNVNVGGTLNMLEAARINGVKRFIFSSSSAVYGNHEGICSETSPCKPTSVYGYSKLMGEELCAQYRQMFDIQTVALRYFNVYGQRQNPNGAYAAVVAKFTDCMKQNKPITIFGDGLQTRDFIHVKNVAKANILCGIAPYTKISNPIINIATGKSINLIQLIDTLKKDFADYNQDIIFAPARTGDIKYSQANCTRLEMLKQTTRTYQETNKQAMTARP